MPSGVRLVGGGLALPGVVSADTGTLLLAPNLGWADLRPVEHLPVDLLPEGAGMLRVGNEADLAARTVAEQAPGRPGPVRDVVYLSGEIGIGGAVVLDGRVMTGQHGWAGEIGHVTVDPDGPCVPVRLDRLPRAVRRQARDPRCRRDGPRQHRRRPRQRRGVGGCSGRPKALDRAARALGIAVAGVLNVLDIPAVVLGGHLGQIADLLHPGLDLQLRARVMSARWAAPTIVPAPVDPAPGATGAAMLELSLVLDQPGLWADHRTSQGASTLR
jgi:predicted NBD/HSP70 family sugar kinase